MHYGPPKEIFGWAMAHPKYRVAPPMQSFLNTAKPQVINLLNIYRQNKIYFVLHCTKQKTDLKTGSAEDIIVPFGTKNREVLEATNTTELYNEVKDKIEETIATFQQRGSGWQFVDVDRLEINVIKYKPLRGKSYIPLWTTPLSYGNMRFLDPSHTVTP
jgi:hypothetical protein